MQTNAFLISIFYPSDNTRCTFYTQNKESK